MKLELCNDGYLFTTDNIQNKNDRFLFEEQAFNQFKFNKLT